MAKPTLKPVTDDTLWEFCQFLHTNLSGRIAVEEWMRAFQVPWLPDRPNYGFLARDQDTIVGGIGAIYSQQFIHGKAEHFCNITSWCVLDAYRAQSMRLAMALVSQQGFHFTDLTPTAVVADALRFLKFKSLDARRTVFPNLPWPTQRLTNIRVISDGDEIQGMLPPDAARIYADHRGFPWLKHVALASADDSCHIIFKRQELKKLPCAEILSVSDPNVFVKYHRILGHHFLFKHGLATTRIESRFLNNLPRFSTQISGYRNRMYRSDTLQAHDITNLYSELMALDL